MQCNIGEHVDPDTGKCTPVRSPSCPDPALSRPLPPLTRRPPTATDATAPLPSSLSLPHAPTPPAQCPPGKYESNNECKPCYRCASSAAGAGDAAECTGAAPQCAAGSAPDPSTYKCVQCPQGWYSPGGTGAAVCGGSPTPSPTTPTYTYISVKHSYSFTSATSVARFNSAAWAAAFQKAVTTVLLVADGSVTPKLFTKTPIAISRRFLLATYTSQVRTPRPRPRPLLGAIHVTRCLCSCDSVSFHSRAITLFFPATQPCFAMPGTLGTPSCRT